MAAVKISVVLIVASVLLLSNATVSRSQDTGIVRFTNKSNSTVVSINNLSQQKIISDLGFNGVAEFNQSINSATVFFFKITNSRTKSLISNLVVPTWTNVSFIDVQNFPDVVVAVGTFPAS